MTRLMTGDEAYGGALQAGDPPAFAPYRYLQLTARQSGRELPDVPVPTETAAEPVCAAYVSYGRWVVDCPFCTSAAIASDADRRFYCADCHNAAVGGALLPVVWPDDDLREAIEQRLTVRPEIKNRNWTIFETEATLRAENVSHGVPD